jgi:hypothetical protein
MTEPEQKFELGQKFEGEYPPEAAAWCEKNGATMEGNLNFSYTIVPKPEKSEEEFIDEAEEMRAVIIQEWDWLALRELERKALDPDYQINRKLLEYRKFLRDFDKRPNWWKEKIPTLKEWKDANSKG